MDFSVLPPTEYLVVAAVILIGWTILGVLYNFDSIECPSDALMNGKTVLITGANTGIGFEAAKELARRGARVLLGCRRPEEGRRAIERIRQQLNGQPVDLELYHLDLSSFKSIHDCCSRINANEPRLDVLINNAGINTGVGNRLQKKTAEGYEIHMGVNHLGHFLLTALLQDLLAKSGPSRVITVSSDLNYFGRIDFDFKQSHFPVRAYANSKLANILFASELHRRCSNEALPISSFSCHPGVVATDLVRGGLITEKIIKRILRIVLKSPKSGAQTLIYLAVAPDLDEFSGRYFINCQLQRPWSRLANDQQLAENLWNFSKLCVH